MVGELTYDGNPDYHLPRGAPQINPYRMQHGNIHRDEDGNLNDSNWLPDILLSKGILEKEHFDTCRSFNRILIQAKRTLGCANVKGDLFEKPLDGVDSNEETDAYLAIRKSIRRKELLLLIGVVEAMATKPNIWGATMAAIDIRHALENVQIVLMAQAVKRQASTMQSGGV